MIVRLLLPELPPGLDVLGEVLLRGGGVGILVEGVQDEVGGHPRRGGWAR